MSSTDVVIHDQSQVQLSEPAMPVMSMPQAVERFRSMQAFVGTIMKDDLDYGKIPGTPRPTLYQPGGEKLCLFFGLASDVQQTAVVKDWTGQDHGGEPFFEFTYRCVITKNGRFLASRDASCNTWETKYRYRWVHSDSPFLEPYKRSGKIDTLPKRGGSMYEFVWAVNKRETGGKWGKPAEYWDMWRLAIDEGRAVSCKRKLKGKDQAAWTMHDFEYRIPNPDPADCVNTAQKISAKRAFVAAVKAATGASEYFTVDLEDFDETHPEVEEEKKKGQKTPYSTGETHEEITARRIAEAHEKAAARKKAAGTKEETRHEEDVARELDPSTADLWNRMKNLTGCYKVMGELKAQMKAVGAGGEAEYYRILSTFDDAKHANDIKRPDQLRMAAAAIFQVLQGLASMADEQESDEQPGPEQEPDYVDSESFDGEDEV